MNEIHDRPLRQFGRGSTPERAIVAAIYRHRTFDSANRIKYKPERPDFADINPGHLEQLEFDMQPAEEGPTTELFSDRVEVGYKQIEIRDLWVEIQQDEPIDVKFRIRLTVPDGALEETFNPPDYCYSWRAELTQVGYSG